MQSLRTNAMALRQRALKSEAHQTLPLARARALHAPSPSVLPAAKRTDAESAAPEPTGVL